MKKIAAVFAFLLFASVSQAQQSVKQSGVVTPGHPVAWTSAGTVQDAGTAVNGFLRGVGVTAAGPGFCQNDGPITSPYHQLCLAISPTAGVISFGAFGGATTLPLQFNINGQTATPGGQFTTLQITRLQIPSYTIGAAYIVTTGYRTAGDLGYGAVYTSVGATSDGLQAIQDASGTWFNLLINGTVNVGWFGAYGDGVGETITSGDITANPQWRGTYTAGTTWDMVAIQEATYAALASTSTPGNIVWNLVNDAAANFNLLIPKGTTGNGTYEINKPLLLAGTNFNITFEPPAGLDWIGPPTTTMWTWNSASAAVINNFHISADTKITPCDFNTCAPLLSMDHTGAIGGLATQNILFVHPTVGLNINGRGIAISSSGNTAQGSTITFVNGQFVGAYGADYAIYIGGNNALNIVLYNSDCQGFAHDCIQNIIGSVYVHDTSFENENLNSSFYPINNQFTTFGADVHTYAGVSPVTQNAIKDVRSESDVGVICETGSYCEIQNVGTSQGSSFTWTASAPTLAGYTYFSQPGCAGNACVGTKYHTFMVVDDAGNGTWNTPTSGSTTSVIQDSTASYTINQWAGYTLWFRYSNGFIESHTIASNTATSITLSTPVAVLPNATNLYHIGGQTGGSPPSWDSAPQGNSTYQWGSGLGFTTTANSAVVGVDSGILTSANGNVAIAANQYVVIPNADCLGAGPQAGGALIAKVLSVNMGAQQITLNKKACYTVTAVFGYWGAVLSDNNITYIDLDFNAFIGGNIATQEGKLINSYSSGGRWLALQSVFNYQNPRLDYMRAFEPNVPELAGTGGFANPPQTYGFYGAVLRGAVPVTPAASIDLTNYILTANYLTLTPTGDTVLNASTPPTTTTAEDFTLIITTSGTNSYNINFGTNFSSAGTLATGTVSGVSYAVLFTWNGVVGKWQEIARGATGIAVGTKTTGFLAIQFLYSDGSVLQPADGTGSLGAVVLSNAPTIDTPNFTTKILGNTSSIITFPAAATWQFGAADAASPVSQTLQFQSVVAGNANTAAANATVQGSLSNGSGAGGDIIFSTTNSSASSGSQNTATETLRLTGGTHNVKFRTSTTGASTQTFTNSPCSGLTTEKWIPVEITGQTGTWNIPACQ